MNRLQKIGFGHCNFSDLVYWIIERHKIWQRRQRSEPKPWTDDPIFQRYKFCNVYRQLDKGTIALRRMLEKGRTTFDDSALILFNVIWYRLFNWYEHAEELGFVKRYKSLERYITKRAKIGKQIFTSAHMTTGAGGFEPKHMFYLRACKEAWDNREIFTEFTINASTMEDVFNKLLDLRGVGRFVAYELVCDLRFTCLLEHATDKLTWANMGPGAQRGLRRLGMPYENQEDGIRSMQKLRQRIICDDRFKMIKSIWPFELREIEHCLCELDKYQRTKRGEGTPRSKYNEI